MARMRCFGTQTLTALRGVRSAVYKERAFHRRVRNAPAYAALTDVIDGVLDPAIKKETDRIKRAMLDKPYRPSRRRARRPRR